MKKRIFSGLLAISIGLFVVSCKDHKEEGKHAKHETEEEHAKHDSEEKHEHEADSEHVHSEMASVEYQCPMNCEDEKTYTKPGSCPVCKMDLKEVKKESNEEESAVEEHKDGDQD